MNKFLTLSALPLVLTMIRPAHAHFLWAQIDKSSNLQLSLAEEQNEEGVASDKIQTSTAWNESGTSLKLEATKTTLKAPLDAKSVIAGAHIDYGVLDKSEAGRGIFLLEYHAKAARELAEAGHNARLKFELFARQDGENVLVTLKSGGKAVPDSTMQLYAPSSEEVEIKTDANGQARFKPTKPGLYGLRASSEEKRNGELAGKKYGLVRHYTTITFPVGSGLAKEVVAPVKIERDQAAWDLLKGAHDARQVVPESFNGFSADLILDVDGEKYNGKVVYNRKAKTEITFADLSADDKSWVEEKLMNLIGHRRGGDFASGDGRNPITFAKLSSNNFGTAVELNDRLKSQYRVKGNKVTEVTRTMGGTKFTISVVDSQETEPGKYLTKNFIVTYRDAETGAIKEIENYYDSYDKIDGVWLPTARTVLEINDEVTPAKRTISLKNIKKLD